NLTKYRTLSFGLAAFYAGIGGALYAHYQEVVSNEGFTIDRSILFLAMVIIGGLGSVMGTLMGTVFMVLLPEAMEWVSAALRGRGGSARGDGSARTGLDRAAGGLFGRDRGCRRAVRPGRRRRLRLGQPERRRERHKGQRRHRRLRLSSAARRRSVQEMGRREGRGHSRLGHGRHRGADGLRRAGPDPVRIRVLRGGPDRPDREEQ